MNRDDLALRVQKAAERAILLRRAMHACPEVDFDLKETLALVTGRLEELGLPWRAVGKAGVAALVEGDAPGETVLLRADMDALPVFEETDVPWRSKRDGFMHGCGHDIHTACLLGAAEVLASVRKDLCGSILLVFQPAEETSGGALPMMQDGLFAGGTPSAAFALHCSPAPRVGFGGAYSGTFCAASDMFDCTVKGRGAHGAEPQNGTDVIALSCQVISALHHLVPRTTDPAEPVVLSVGTFRAGTARNILPERAEFSGILRTLDDGTRMSLKAKIRRTVMNIPDVLGAVGEVRFTEGYPMLRNDSAMTALVLRTAEALLGEGKAVTLTRPQLAVDDFAYFLREIPGCYFLLGTAHGDGREEPPLHSPRFDPDEECLPVGIEILAGTALSFLEGGYQK